MLLYLYIYHNSCILWNSMLLIDGILQNNPEANAALSI